MRRRPRPLCSRMLLLERKTHEHVTTNMSLDTDHPSPLIPPPDTLLAEFFSKLPQELRDITYTHLATFLSNPPPAPPDLTYGYLTAPHKTFILQPPFLFPLTTSPPQNVPASFPPRIPSIFLEQNPTPFSPLPFIIPLSPPPLLHRLITEFESQIVTPFFASITLWTRYRFTSALPDFLAAPFQGTTCVPARHLRELNIFLGQPESCEDSYGLDDEEAEYEWGAMFPEARNERCAMLRAQMEGDFARLGELLREGCVVTVWLMDSRSDVWAAGVDAWIKGWAEGVKGRGVKISVKIY